MEEFSISEIAGLVQLAIGALTLLYLVFGLGARVAVTEFKVNQLWRWYIEDRRLNGKGDDAGADRG